MSNTPNLSYLGRHKRRVPRDRRKQPDLPVSFNDCFKPAADAGSLTDFREFHEEEMKIRRAKRRASPMQPSYDRWIKPDWKRTQEAAWRRSIWPDSKVAKPGRMA